MHLNMFHVSYHSLPLHSLSEVPECHLPIAQRADVLRQALDMSTSYLYTCKTSVVAVSVFICIAQSYDTHKYVATPGILERLIACCTHRETQHATEHSELLAFKWVVVGVFFSDLCTFLCSYMIASAHDNSIFISLTKSVQTVLINV